MSDHPGFNGDQTIRAGAICTIASGDGKFGAVKVLHVTPFSVHVAIFKNKYEQRPAGLDISTLSLGTIYDTDGFGIGHVPLSHEGFTNWQPVVLGFEEVTEAEEERLDM